jgi:hypothetical protein
MLATGLALLPLNTAPAQEAGSCTKAGYGQTDATYPVGVSAGQYSDTRESDDNSTMDPHTQQVKNAKSYGVQSRLTVRAIVVQGCDGDTVALVKNDHYLAQDAYQRRVGQILAAAGSAVTYDNILTAASHNHSSPYVITPSWGVWAFQDAFDARQFEFFARKMADAILTAEADLQPARMGATEVHHEIFKANIPGPATADDGTPAGYPRGFGDLEIVVMRFDNADTGKPIATWMNHGQHPESLDGYNIITADFLAPLERFVDRETGAPLVFSQSDVGSSEGPYDGWTAPPAWLPDGTRRAWAHTGYGQAERGARYLADSVIQGFEDIGNGGGVVPFSTDFEVRSYNGWIPAPKSHPYPSVSNCRSESTAEGNPGAPVVGLPDCAREGDSDPNNLLWESLKEHGLPVPEHYDAPAFTGVEENLRIRLQAIRLGDVILGSCACEAQVDLILNFESRVDDNVGNLWDGYEWDCTRPGYDPEAPDGAPDEDHTWTCVYPDAPGGTRDFTFSDYEYRRMLGQVHNDAAGWDAPEYVPFANSEPADISQIKGNFTKEELGGTGAPVEGSSVLETPGYKLAVGIGHAGDYTGYTVSYREYMNRDHYRKALTCCGAHTADYQVTNLVHMAAALKGGPDLVAENPYYAVGAADEARQIAQTEAVGAASSAAYDAWYASLPEDANPGTITKQPEDIRRFDAATFKWTGGSNVVDGPVVEVQRRKGKNWETYADQTGEVQTFVEFPALGEGLVTTRAGQEEWTWTANFEAFDFGPRTDIDPRGSQTPGGHYRFAVSGTYRQGLEDVAYQLTSDPFKVKEWDGIRVTDVALANDSTVTFKVSGYQDNAAETQIAPGHTPPPIRYPRTYENSKDPIISTMISDDGGPLCKTCSFRPWAPGSFVARAELTVVGEFGTRTVPAACDVTGNCRSLEPIYQGETAYVDEDGIVDTYGETNGEASDSVSGTGPSPSIAVAPGSIRYLP